MSTNDIIYDAKCCLLGFEYYKPVGELFCDYNLKAGKIEKYYIRDYYSDGNNIFYNDIPIDYTTLKEIPDYEILGIDLAESNDLTYYNGDYLQ